MQKNKLLGKPGLSQSGKISRTRNTRNTSLVFMIPQCALMRMADSEVAMNDSLSPKALKAFQKNRSSHYRCPNNRMVPSWSNRATIYFGPINHVLLGKTGKGRHQVSINSNNNNNTNNNSDNNNNKKKHWKTTIIIIIIIRYFSDLLRLLLQWSLLMLSTHQWEKDISATEEWWKSLSPWNPTIEFDFHSYAININDDSGILIY